VGLKRARGRADKNVMSVGYFLPSFVHGQEVEPDAAKVKKVFDRIGGEWYHDENGHAYLSMGDNSSYVERTEGEPGLRFEHPNGAAWDLMCELAQVGPFVVICNDGRPTAPNPSQLVHLPDGLSEHGWESTVMSLRQRS
jgi:hypothetical protein